MGKDDYLHPLYKNFPKWKDKKLSSFIELLDSKDIEEELNIFRAKASLSILNRLIRERAKNAPNFNNEEIEELSAIYYADRFTEIKEHEMYSILNESKHFEGMINWISTRSEYNKGDPKIILKILNVLIMTILKKIYFGSHEAEKESLDNIKKISSLSKKLKSQIERSNFYDSNLTDCIKELQIPLNFLAGYEPVKLLRKDDTFEERALLQYIVNLFYLYDLKIMTRLIEQILNVMDLPNLGADRRNLIKNIRKARDNNCLVPQFSGVGCC